QVGDDAADYAGAGQGQGAGFQHLGLTVLVGVIHDHDHALDARDQVHGAAHALHQLAGDHPVGDVAVLGHLHRAEDRQVDVAAADHGEAVGAAEIGALGDLGDGLLAGVDQVGVFFTLIGEGAHAQHAVLGLQGHFHSGGDVVGHQ